MSRAPEWLLQPEVGLCPCGCTGKRRKGGYLARTLAATSDFARRSMFSEDCAAAPGLLQRLDARVKIVSLLGLVVVAGFLRSVPPLVVMALATVALAVASHLPVRLFLARVWLSVPIFTGIVAVPATLNVVTPGTVVVPLGTWFGGPLGVTAEGLESGGLLVMRVAVSISLVVLLTFTTPWSRLLAALRALRVPTTVVLVLAMASRYLFHLLTSVGDMYTARRARTVVADTDVATGRRFVAASAGALFGKSHALAEEVYLAMVSRGYTGEARVLEPARIGTRDWIWVGACTAAATLVLGGAHAVS